MTTFQSIIYENSADFARETVFLSGKIGQVSGDTYLEGSYTLANTSQLIYIARQTEKTTNVWNKIYDHVLPYYAFDVSPTEDYLYYCLLSTSQLMLYKVDASNGNADTVLELIYSSFFFEYSPHIAITPSNDALYINTDSNS